MRILFELSSLVVGVSLLLLPARSTYSAIWKETSPASELNGFWVTASHWVPSVSLDCLLAAIVSPLILTSADESGSDVENFNVIASSDFARYFSGSSGSVPASSLSVEIATEDGVIAGALRSMRTLFELSSLVVASSLLGLPARSTYSVIWKETSSASEMNGFWVTASHWVPSVSPDCLRTATGSPLISTFAEESGSDVENFNVIASSDFARYFSGSSGSVPASSLSVEIATEDGVIAG